MSYYLCILNLLLIYLKMHSDRLRNSFHGYQKFLVIRKGIQIVQ